MSKKEKYILGVDVGTASVGLAVYELDDQDQPVRLVHLESYLFGEPTSKSQSGYAMLNQNRRQKRLMERQVTRKAQQKKHLYQVFQQAGFLSDGADVTTHADAPEAHVIALRASAVSKKIALADLYRVCAHISQGRGYYGALNKNDGAVGKSISLVEQEMATAGVETLGQLWDLRRTAAEASREPWKHINGTGTYKYRAMIEQEFDLIMATQTQHHPLLAEPMEIQDDRWIEGGFRAGQAYPFAEVLRHVIFYQEPIRWSTDTIGPCTLFVDDKSVSRASPAFQDFRSWKTLLDLKLRIYSTNEVRRLGLEEMETVYDLLKAQETVRFSKIYKALGLSENECAFTNDRRAATNDPDAGLKGHQTDAVMRTLKLAKPWQALESDAQEAVIQFLADMVDPVVIETPYVAGYETVPELIKGVVQTPLTPEALQAVADFLMQMAQHKKFGTLQSMGFPHKRANYGVRALGLLTDLLQGGMQEADAVADVRRTYGLPDTTIVNETGFVMQQITDITTNPVVRKAFAETARAVNHVIKKFGLPDRVVIELNREMKQSLKDRWETEKQISKNRNEREQARKGISASFPDRATSKKDVQRFLLWQEQGKRCAYSGKALSLEHILDPAQSEIDHIVPRRRGGGNQRWNMVIVERSANQVKGALTPFQALQVKNFPPNYGTAIQKMAQSLDVNLEKNQKKPFAKLNPQQKKARLLVSEQDPKDQNEFREAQYEETAWIGRVIRDHIAALGCDVFVTRGTLTGYLRQIWQIDEILPRVRQAEGLPLFNDKQQVIDDATWQESLTKKRSERDQAVIFDKRCDHRHHAIDAAVIALSTRSLMQRANQHTRKHRILNGHTKPTAYDDFGNVTEKVYVPGFLYDDAGTLTHPLPYASFRQELTEWLIGYVPWHKPDFFPAGAKFAENPVSIVPQGEGRVAAIRISMSSFAQKVENAVEKQKKNGEAAIARKIDLIFADIIGAEIRDSVRAQFSRRRLAGLSVQEALCGQAPYKDETDENLPEVIPTLPDGRPDGIYFPEQTRNRVKKLKYKSQSFREGVDFVKPTRTKKPGQQGWLNDGFAVVRTKPDGADWAFIPLYQYDPKQKVPEGYIQFFKSQIIFSISRKAFYRIVGLNLGLGTLQAVLLTESVASYEIARQASKAAAEANFKSYDAHLQIRKTTCQDVIPINSRGDLVRIRKKYLT